MQKKAEKVQLYMSVIHGSYKADIYGLVINFNYDFPNDFALMRYDISIWLIYYCSDNLL